MRQKARDVLSEQCRIDRADAGNGRRERQCDPERADHGTPIAQRNVHQGKRAPTIEPRRLGKDLLGCKLNATAPSFPAFRSCESIADSGLLADGLYPPASRGTIGRTDDPDRSQARLTRRTPRRRSFTGGFGANSGISVWTSR